MKKIIHFLRTVAIFAILGVFAVSCEMGTGETQTNNPGNSTTTGSRALITLNETTASFTGTNVNILQHNLYGTIVEINNSGTYTLQGTLKQGFVAISKKDLDVTLVLNGVNINCKNYAAITCLKKSNVTIELAANTTNYLSDGGEAADADGKYGYDYDSDEAPNAALLIRKDLTIRGSGKLIVTGNANNGIGSRGNLRIESGDITVTAANNAIKGNDSITITGGKFNLTAGSDGIKTDEESVAGGLANITISGGEFTITAVNDAVEAEANLTISNAIIKIKTGGGSDARATSDSAKGLKAGAALNIHSGTFNIDSNDDSIHSNGTVTINGGTFTISSGDDGIHADTRLTINNGTINILKCYEGLESYDMDLNGGLVKIKSSDDGINIAGGNDGSALAPNRPGPGADRPGQPGAMPGGGMQGGGGMGGGGMGQIIDGTIRITGGEYYIESQGDGIDSNGKIVMTGGTIVIFGPISEPDTAIDYDVSFEMTGGTIVGLGSTGRMARQPNSSSTQYTFMATLPNDVSAGSLINVSSEAGKEIMTVKAAKNTRGLIVCSPLLDKGNYKISTGGTHSGTENNLGLMVNGSYSGGSVTKTFTISSIVTTVN